MMDFNSLEKRWSQFTQERGAVQAQILLKPAHQTLTPEIQSQLEKEGYSFEEKNACESRKKEWVGSRLSLIQILSEMGKETQTGVSHSAYEGESWTLVAGAKGEVSIGVDLEFQGRKVRHSVWDRVIRPLERKWELDPLSLWTLKEAALKADPLSKGRPITDYVLAEWDPQTSEGRVVSEFHGMAMEVSLIRWDPWWIGFGVQRKER